MYLIIFEDDSMIKMKELSDDILRSFNSGYVSIIDLENEMFASPVDKDGYIYWHDIEEQY